MESRSFRFEEILGLALAVVFHIALVVFLVTRPPPDPQEPEEVRVGVSLASAVSLESTTPDIMPDSQAAAASSGSDVPIPMPEIEQSEDITTPDAVSKPKPQPTRKPRPTQTKKPKKPKKPKKDNGNKGSKGKTDGKGKTGDKDKGKKDTGFGDAFNNVAAAKAKADIKVSIGSQVRRHWERCRVSAPGGSTATVTFRLDRSGKINLASIGKPQVKGVPADRKQLFGNCAVTALKRVKKFNGLPTEHYDIWKNYKFTFKKG